MTDPVKATTEYVRQLFTLYEEFFIRATGRAASEFASVDEFSAEIRRNAPDLARRGHEAFRWLDTEMRAFYSRSAPSAFKNAASLGGMTLVLGGGSVFRRSQLDSTSISILYSDTVLVADPVLPWLEVERPAEKFPHVIPLQGVHALLQLKPVVDADLPIPPLVVFPSFEKVLEARDPQTQLGMTQMLVDVLAQTLGESLATMEEVLDFVESSPDRFLQLVDENHLFVAPGGPLDEPLDRALSRYWEEAETWRSTEWQEAHRDLPPQLIVLNALLERIGPIYHLIENAEELRSHPLMCLEQQAHYFRMVTSSCNERLETLDALSPETRALVDALGSRQLTWLGGIPVEALVTLRVENENVTFRRRLSQAVENLQQTGFDDMDRVVVEVCREIDIAIAEHDRELERIQSKFQQRHVQTASTALAAAGACLIPALAPLLGATAPLALAGKYFQDKAAELRKKKELSRSLMGVLATAQRSSATSE